MKCISKKKKLILVLSASILLVTGCSNTVVLNSPYDISGVNLSTDTALEPFAKELCIPSGNNVSSDSLDLSLSEAGALFNLGSKEVVYSKNVYERLYPASLTKSLTALIALKYGNLEDVITISENAVIKESGAQLCGFLPGDKITLEQALYGLMIYSGNDAGVAIAEHISGSVEAFAELMNKEAASLGATNSHFMNPHGLHEEEHYTTAYDLYLIFQEAIKYDKFMEIIQTKEYNTSYILSDGTEKEITWNTTNLFLKGDVQNPEGIIVLGGKTGTTQAAGSCLILLSKNQTEETFVSIILKSQDRTTLYTQMADLLNEINK